MNMQERQTEEEISTSLNNAGRGSAHSKLFGDNNVM